MKHKIACSVAAISAFLLITGFSSISNHTEPVSVLKAAGFQCTEQASTSCKGKVSGYPREVVFVIPAGYQFSDQLELIVHLHGHTHTEETRTLFEKLHLARFSEMLARTKRNAILVVPRSLGKCTDFKAMFRDTPHGFETFIQSVTLLLGAQNIRSLVLTGHSGAYSTLAKIIESKLARDKIHELYLFDAAYGNAEEFINFAENPTNRFWSVFLPEINTFTATSKVSRLMMNELRSRNVQYRYVVNDQMLDASFRVGFVRSSQNHFTALNNTFVPLLKTATP